MIEKLIEPQYFLTVVHHCCVSRNAEAAPWTRHAQLLLPVSWRSGADHATARMVSHRRTKAKKHAQLIHVNDEQILSCLFTSVAQRLCASSVHWMKEWWPPTQGRSAAGCSCCTTALCAQHMSNTSQHTCPCITIWLLNPHQSLLQALRSLSLTLCLWSTLFVSFTSYLSFFLTAPL